MTKEPTLKLTGSRQFSGRENDKGEVVDVVFWVDADQLTTKGVAHAVEAVEHRSFWLRAVRSDVAAGQDLDREHGGEPGHRGTFPLPVYKENLAPGETVAEHVQRVYLDKSEPQAINDAAQFLVPADADTTTTPPPYPAFRNGLDGGDFSGRPLHNH